LQAKPIGPILKCVWSSINPEIQLSFKGAIIGLILDTKKAALQNLYFFVSEKMQMNPESKVKIFGKNSKNSESISLNEANFNTLNKYILQTYDMVISSNSWKVISFRIWTSSSPII
jgi:hypothetical protein